jgi:hypothetical protein
LTLDRVTRNETTVVFEFRDEGLMWGNPQGYFIVVRENLEALNLRFALSKA